MLQELPIVPNLANVESKLKTMIVSRDRNECNLRSDIFRKRNAKPPGKVKFFTIILTPGTSNFISKLTFQTRYHITYTVIVLVGQYNGAN